MRSISQAVHATQIASDNSMMTLLRVIGTTDIDGRGTKHVINHVDPFIFLDEAIIHGEISTGFQKHPHTGLMAVSYLLDGTVRAWDNIYGIASELNKPGGVYTIDAGRGVVHGEAPIEGFRKIRLLQLWINPGLTNLPKATYQLYQPNQLPVFQDQMLWVKIIIGEAFGLTSPVKIRWPIQYLHIKLDPHQIGHLDIPHKEWHGFVYILHGQGIFGKNDILGSSQHCLILGNELTTTLRFKNISDQPLEILLATGKPHNQSFFKLLGHGGAIVADTETHARDWMKTYEQNPDHFGR